MKTLNCPNCGAPISSEENKCPFCGTSYFDLSAIDINNSKPFYLKIRMGNIILTQLVKVLPDMNIEMSTNEDYTIEHNGIVLSKAITSRNINTNLTFQAIEDPKRHSFCEIILTK